MNLIDDLLSGDNYQDIIDSFRDTERYPAIIDSLSDIFLLDKFDEEYRGKKFDYYEFNGIGVPRVSRIMDATINNEFLMNWAINLGNKKYHAVKNTALTIGSRTHEMIESYLRTGIFPKDIFIKVPGTIRQHVKIGYENFVAWTKSLASRNIFLEDIISIERVLTCPYFGGTADCICRINGRVYLIDFKTSKRLSYTYLMQVCAYAWMINAGYCPNMPKIEGVGLIRIDKDTKNKFDDLFLSYCIPEHAAYIDMYTKGFGYLVQAYYNTIQMERSFPQINREARDNKISTLGGREE